MNKNKLNVNKSLNYNAANTATNGNNGNNSNNYSINNSTSQALKGASAGLKSKNKYLNDFEKLKSGYANKKGMLNAYCNNLYKIIYY